MMATRSKSPKVSPMVDAAAVARAEAAHGLDPASIALSKARAAWLLFIVTSRGDEYLQMPVQLSKENEEKVRDWIESFAVDALDAALCEASEAVKEMHARMGVPDAGAGTGVVTLRPRQGA